ncbi:MAG: alpha/beta hydrolase [Planctomycetota bacterium]
MAGGAARARRRRESRGFALRWSAALISGATPVLAAAGCAIPGPQSDRATLRALERVSYDDPLGRELSYLRSGDPTLPRLMYVHGSPSDATAFGDELVNPVPGFESLSTDRPGYGTAAHTGPVGSFEEQAAALEPLLETRRGRAPILIGHSLGGPIIARAAADFPGRVDGLVIVAGSLDPSLEKPRWYNHIAGAPPARWVMPGILKVSNAEMMAAPEQTRLLAEVLADVRCPVAIVHGTEDGLVPYANVAYMERTLVNAAALRVWTLENEGHFLVWNDAGRSAIREAIAWVAGEAESAPTSGRNDPYEP